MTDFIKSKLKEHKINCKDVALVLPESVTYVRRFFMPYMTVQQLKFNLPFEFHDFITEDKDRYFYDYAVMEVVEEENDGVLSKSLDILGAAISKEAIEKYRTMLRRCGLKLRIAAPQPCAYQNMIHQYEEFHGITKSRDYAILDLGHETTELRIFTEGKYETGREIEIGIRTITEAIADTLGLYEQTEAQIQTLKEQTEHFDEVRKQYRQFDNSFLSEAETKRQDRLEVLDMVEKARAQKLFQYDRIEGDCKVENIGNR